MAFSVIFRVLLIVLLCFVGNTQERQFKIHTIAFYNLENLFDTLNDPLTFDEFTPIMEMKSERGAAYRSKIRNIAKTIADIGKEKTKNNIYKVKHTYVIS